MKWRTSLYVNLRGTQLHDEMEYPDDREVKADLRNRTYRTAETGRT